MNGNISFAENWSIHIFLCSCLFVLFQTKHLTKSRFFQFWNENIKNNVPFIVSYLKVSKFWPDVEFYLGIAANLKSMFQLGYMFYLNDILIHLNGWYYTFFILLHFCLKIFVMYSLMTISTTYCCLLIINSKTFIRYLCMKLLCNLCTIWQTILKVG